VLWPCTIKHYGFLIYGKARSGNVIKLLTTVVYKFS
jgi:hypothetical protein